MQRTAAASPLALCLPVSILDSPISCVLYVKMKGGPYPQKDAKGAQGGGGKHVSRGIELGFGLIQGKEVGKVGLDRHGGFRRAGRLLHGFNRRLEPKGELVSEHREEGFANLGANRGNPVRCHARRAGSVSGPAERREERRGRPRRLSSHVLLALVLCETSRGLT